MRREVIRGQVSVVVANELKGRPLSGWIVESITLQTGRKIVPMDSSYAAEAVAIEAGFALAVGTPP